MFSIKPIILSLKSYFLDRCQRKRPFPLPNADYDGADRGRECEAAGLAVVVGGGGRRAVVVFVGMLLKLPQYLSSMYIVFT